MRKLDFLAAPLLLVLCQTMLELAITGIITVSSTLLLGYWARCTYLLLFREGACPPLEAASPLQELPDPQLETACLVDSAGREVPATD